MDFFWFLSARKQRKEVFLERFEYGQAQPSCNIVVQSQQAISADGSTSETRRLGAPSGEQL